MRKTLTALAVALTVMFVFASVASASVYVRGYFKSNGTYVQPHYRSDPDGYFWNNWSSYGNINPYTGKIGTKWPSYTPSYSYRSYYPSYVLSYTYQKLLSKLFFPQLFLLKR